MAEYSKLLADEICTRIIEGQTLTQILKDPHMPNRRTVVRWLTEKKDFAAKYESARTFMADTLFDEILDIADGRAVENPQLDFSNRSQSKAAKMEGYDRQVRIEARKYVISKLAPKKYGDTKQVEISGNVDKPLTTVTRIELVVPKILQQPDKALPAAKELPVIEHASAIANASD